MNRVLVVEDDARMARMLITGLRRNGFAATVADSGGSALRLARDGAFDVLVLDLGLPDVDGLAVLRELRRRGERLPVLILSARADLDTTVAGLHEGADDYLTKPFRFDELIARMRSRLRASGIEPFPCPN